MAPRVADWCFSFTACDRKDGNGETDAATYQDIPFSVAFNEVLPTRLTVTYTPPGAKSQYLWTDDADFAIDTTHNIAMAWDTIGGGNSKLEVWLDGRQVLEKGGLSGWTGDC